MINLDSASRSPSRKLLTSAIVALLRSQKRVELHGIVHDGYLPCVRVLSASEEKKLKRLAA